MEVKLNETKIMMPSGMVHSIRVNTLAWIPVRIPLGDRYIVPESDNQYYYIIIHHTVVVPVIIDQLVLTGDEDNQQLEIKVKSIVNNQLITLKWDDFECRFNHDHQFEFESWLHTTTRGSLHESELLDKHRIEMINIFVKMIQFALNNSDLKVEVPFGWQIIDMFNRNLRVVEEDDGIYYRLEIDAFTRTLGIVRVPDRVRYPKFDEL